MAPLPAWLQPLQMRSANDVSKLAARVFHKPRMTLAEHESKLAGAGADGRDAPPGEGIADSAQSRALEDAELFATRDARADVDALGGTVNSAPTAVRAVDRKAWVARAVSPKAEHFREQARSVNAPGAAIDNPCVEFRRPLEMNDDSAGSSAPCQRTALDPLYATLDAIVRNDSGARAGIVVLGNSLIASDHVTDVVRARLVERFGDAGRGFLLPDRLSKVAGRRVRTGQATAGWSIATFAQDPPTDGSTPLFGLSGSLHTSTQAGDATTWELDGATRARLFYVEHTGQPAMRLEVRTAQGSKLVGRVDAINVDKSAIDETFDIALPADAKELTVTVQGAGAQLSGVAIERDHAGVVLDTIGVPAASVRLYVDGVQPDAFARQLAARDPALVVLMLGGNEVRAFDFGTLDAATLGQKLDTLLVRVKAAAPRAACLLVAPIDAAKATAAGEELVTRAHMGDVLAIQQQAARKHGCAYFNLFAAMGGKGSLAQFRDKGFLSDDLVHPTWRGGDVLGQLFADALVENYVDTAAPTGMQVARRSDAPSREPTFAGLSFPENDSGAVAVKGQPAPPHRRALARVFAKLRALEHGDTNTRVAIGQLGASHTAGQVFTDRVRARFAARFGSAGRGFVSVGRSSSRLEQGGVYRTIDGNFEIADGRDVVMGGTVGMSGTKARLEPGAHFAVEFCATPPTDAHLKRKHAHAIDAPLPAGCFAHAAPGFVQLAWLYTPDMGTAEVAVDGKTVARISPVDRDPQSDVQFLRIPVDAQSPVLEVSVLAPLKSAAVRGEHDDAIGPVHLLSVVQEREGAGVVVDAVGLPGTTGMTPQRWRQDILGAEVAARNYDLVVTAWGTNEAGIASLDEATYRHHFDKTLTTLLQASPGADCLIVGASDRLDSKPGGWRAAPAHALVERVQRDLAAAHGCAFYSLRTAMGGAGSMERWVKEGLGHDDHVHFTPEGYVKLADQFVDDLMAAYAFDGLLQQRAKQIDAAPRNAEAAARVSDRRGG